MTGRVACIIQQDDDNIILCEQLLLFSQIHANGNYRYSKYMMNTVDLAVCGRLSTVSMNCIVMNHNSRELVFLTV